MRSPIGFNDTSPQWYMSPASERCNPVDMYLEACNLTNHLTWDNTYGNHTNFQMMI